MKEKWTGILFGCYCFGCAAILFLSLFSYDCLSLALVYAGLSVAYVIVISIAAWYRQAGGDRKIKTIVFCPECRGAIALTEANQAPKYVGGKEKSVDDYVDFIKWHNRHSSRIKYLNVVLGPWKKKDVPWEEPVKTLFYLAKWGWGFYWVKSSRKDINEPLDYRVWPIMVIERGQAKKVYY